MIEATYRWYWIVVCCTSSATVHLANPSGQLHPGVTAAFGC